MNNSAQTLPPLQIETTVPARFREVAQHLADLPAIVDGEQRISYSLLDRWSDDVAQILLDGVDAAAQPVALAFPHDASVIAAILGALKAGRPYAVLDPAMPASRLRTVVDNLDAAHIITTATLAPVLAPQAPHGTTILTLQAPRQPTAAAPIHRPHLAPNDVAAIYYTSGTTDRPKGVVWDHAMLMHTAWQGVQVYPVGPADVTALLYSCAYPSSVADIFGALLNGSTLTLYRLVEQGIARLRDWLDTQRVTMLHVHASVLRQLLDTLPPGHSLEHLRFIRPSGRTPVADIRRLQAHLHPEAICAHWLSSAETLQITRLVMRAGTELSGEFLPVGCPVDSAQITLLGPEGQPVEPGTAGEIVVRSRYLARGYWRQPELTAQRFQNDPDDPDVRIYRMGDLGRWRPDGRLEWLGRNDRRVKIRGYTVDLDAVERAVSGLPQVSEATVTTISTAHDTKLIAYLCSTAAANETAVSVLRMALAHELPEYMLPARFVVLDALPRQPNGKVDASALPPPGKARPDLDTPFVAPRSELEQQIADIWTELLELDEVGVDDNFFELGGDSILAMRMALQVESLTGVRLTPHYFRSPTIRAASTASFAGGAPQAPAAISSLRAAAYAERGKRRQFPTQRHSAARVLFQQGPIWHGKGLPYPAGIALQRLLIRIPGLKTLFARRQIDRLTVWRHSLADPLEWQQVVETRLAAVLWSGWRQQMLSDPSTRERWVVALGAARLREAERPARVVLADNHCLLAWSKRSLYARYGIEPLRVGFWGPARQEELHADYALQLLAARDALACGVPVVVAGDGFGGKQGVDIPFFGHMRRFRSGAAALAVHTGAAVMPVFTTLQADGTIMHEVLPPLVKGTGDPTTQAEHLTRQYAALYMARWPALLAVLPWDQLDTLNRELGLVQA